MYTWTTRVVKRPITSFFLFYERKITGANG